MLNKMYFPNHNVKPSFIAMLINGIFKANQYQPVVSSDRRRFIQLRRLTKTHDHCTKKCSSFMVILQEGGRKGCRSRGRQRTQ